MALIEYDVYKQKLREIEPELEKLSAALDMDAARQEAERLEAETAMDGFWNNLERSQKVQMRLKQLQNKIQRQEKLISTWEDLSVLCEMGQEEDDPDLLAELNKFTFESPHFFPADASSDQTEQAIAAQVRMNQRLLQQVLELDKVLSLKVAREKSFYQ